MVDVLPPEGMNKEQVSLAGLGYRCFAAWKKRLRQEATCLPSLLLVSPVCNYRRVPKD